MRKRMWTNSHANQALTLLLLPALYASVETWLLRWLDRRKAGPPSLQNSASEALEPVTLERKMTNHKGNNLW